MATETFPIIEQRSGPPAPPRPPSGGSDGGGHSFRGRSPEFALRTYLTGMWLALGGITMVFISFTSAMIVRRGVSFDWRPTGIPRLFWLNSAVLVASSLTLELARRGARTGIVETFRKWWWITTALGIAFLSGQIVAWKQLAAAGIYMSSNPS